MKHGSFSPAFQLHTIIIELKLLLLLDDNIIAIVEKAAEAGATYIIPWMESKSSRPDMDRPAATGSVITSSTGWTKISPV